MQPGHILKKLNLDLLTPTLGSGGGGGQGSASKIFATILLHFKISFKLKYFDPILVSGGGGGVCSQNICYHVTAFLILINLICNINMF